jgi:AcrR family transcriptional regulator
MPDLTTEPKKRADAQANHDRILEVALEAFTRDPDASLNSIAKSAGVGAGTLYRHFPTRDHLIGAVYRHEVDELAAAAERLARTRMAPAAALRAWFDRVAQYGMTKAGLKRALEAASVSDFMDPGATHATLVRAIDLLLERGQSAGELTRDVSAEDVCLAIGFLWRLDPESDWEPQAARLLDLVLAGLRTPAAPTA